MGIQIDLRPGDGTGQLFDTVRGAALGQLKSEVFGLVVGKLHRHPSEEKYHKVIQPLKRTNAIGQLLLTDGVKSCWSAKLSF